MPTKPTTSAKAAELRRRAEVQLRKRRKHQRSEAVVPKSAVDTQRLLHELQVHQVELEMQNEELRKARDEMEAGLDKYSDLYDFAPVAYLTLDREGDIREANLAGASLLGIPRGELMKRRFGAFVAPSDRSVYAAFFKQVFESEAREECDVRLLLAGEHPVDVRMRANVFESGQSCRLAVSDITQHKLAEATTAQLAAIVKYSKDAIIGKDLNSIVTSWNAGAEKVFGYAASEMVGKPITRLIPSDRHQEEAQIMGRIRRGESVEHYDTVRVTKDGRQLDVSVTISPIKYATGKIVGASKVARDITERKLWENRLSASEIRYRRLFEAAHAGVLLLDPGTCQITDANPFMTRLLGYPRDQFVGKELFEIGLLKDKAASRDMFRKLKKNREIRYEDLPLESQSGRHLEVEVVANLYEESGHPVIQCNIRDITERKQAEDIVRQNQVLFSALIEQAPVGVLVMDARFRLQQVNPVARLAFSKVQPLIGRFFLEIMHAFWPKRVADQIAARFRHTLKTGAPYRVLNFSERRRDIGVKEVYEWQVQRVTLPAGEQGVVCFFNNITKRKQAEETQRRLAVLAASNQKLEREIIRRQAVEAALQKSEQHQIQLSEEARHLAHQLLSAHEEERKRISRELHDVIAQTLTGINIRLATLKKAAAFNTKDLDRHIARTQQLVEHSVQIIHQFARELRPSVLDDLGLIPALNTFMKHFREETGIRVRLSAVAEVERVDGDGRTVLYRVAQEALTNVARHAHASRAEVKIQEQDRAVCMTIEDDGKGFNTERVLHSKKQERLGVLGMRERVEMVGGSFSLQSAPGKGTSIRVQIPLATVRGGGKLPDGVR